MEVDHSRMKLGKGPAKHDPTVPKMAAFLPAKPTFPPAYAAAAGKVKWDGKLNQTLGCCTICGVANKVAADTAIVRTAYMADEHAQLAMYEKWDGYDPHDPSTDQGGIEADVLAKWYEQGFFGHHVVAYGSVNWRDHDQVRHLIAETNGLYIGVGLPISAQTQAVWGEGGQHAPSDEIPGSWGGHCVEVLGYSSKPDGSLDRIKFVSWGKEMEMTADFWDRYVDEAWAVLLGAFIKEGKSPSGIDVAALEAEIRRLKSSPQ